MDTDRRSNPRPVVAVLANSGAISNFRRQTVNPRLRLMVEANKEVNNILYFFSLRQVKLKEGKITGYYWHNRYNRWLQRDFPFPDIFYIRVGIDRRYAQTFSELCKVVTGANGKIITHYRFNKWRLYQIMRNDPAMRDYLPATRAVRQPEDIQNMLRRYKTVYLKSYRGRKGENVLRVETLPGGYRFSYFRFCVLTVNTVPGFRALLQVVYRFFQGKRFIVQQGIPLLQHNNSLIDMRAELQRNGKGGLGIAGISVRRGRPGSPITTHGDAFRFEDFFVNKMGYSKRKMVELRSGVYDFLYSVYEYIDRHYDKYAELGIDFGIDTSGKIWFIEANSQSTKVSLTKAYGRTGLLRNYKNILEYTAYLSGR